MKISQEEMKRLVPDLSAATKHVAAVSAKWSGTELSLWFPLPHRNLSPNARCHYMAKAKHVKAARTVGKCAAWSVIGESEPPMWPAARVQCTFTFANRIHRDADNLLASLKAIFDGLADAGIVANDSGFTHEPVVITEPDKTKVGVVIRILAHQAGE